MTSDYRGVAVAVTGSNGFLGSALVRALSTAGARVTPVARPLADVRSADCWRRLVQDVDAIFHLAGITSVAEADRDPEASRQSIVLPIVHLETAARSLSRSPRVVFASTATVYGFTETLPVGEDTEVRPATTYDQMKLEAEQRLARASADGAVDAVSLRIANVYGPSPAASQASDRGVLNQAARLAFDGATVHVYGDGNYLRDYVYIDDVVRAFLLAGRTPGMHSACNVASGTGITVAEAFQTMTMRAELRTGRRSAIQRVPWPDGSDPIERRSFTARIDRIAAACSWRPTVSFEQGIDALLDHVAGVRAGAP